MARSFKQRGTVVVPLAESPIPMVEVESIDNPAIFSETVAGEGNITGLTVYGKSTQDGTPSPENPVPIVSAGDGGSIGLTVSDGADQSQSLTFSTPNGLPGIPVDSGGNFVDADGQEWICDYRDWARGVDVKNVETISAPELTDINIGQVSGGWVTDGNTIPFYNYYTTINKPISVSNYGYCTHYKNIGASIVTSDIEGCFAGLRAFFAFRIQKAKLVEYGYDDTDQAGTGPSAFLAWLNAHSDLQFFYIINPVESPIPADELAAYRALHTYDGTTVISVNSDPIAPGVKTTVKIIDPNSGNPQIMQLWLDKEGHPVNINGRGARVGGTPTQQYILQPCSF